MFLITRKEHKKIIHNLENEHQIIDQQLKCKYETGLNYYRNLFNVSKEKLESKIQENLELANMVQQQNEIIKKMEANKKASDTLKRRNINARRRAKTALIREQQETNARIANLVQKNNELEENRVSLLGLVTKMQEEIDILKRKPTLEELKFEKSLKVDRNKLIGSKRKHEKCQK